MLSGFENLRNAAQSGNSWQKVTDYGEDTWPCNASIYIYNVYLILFLLWIHAFVTLYEKYITSFGKTAEYL